MTMRKILAVLTLALLLFAPAARADLIVLTYSSAGGVSSSSTTVWTGSNTFTDSLFTIADDGDATKKIAFQASGITTANTATVGVNGTAGSPFLTIGGVTSAFNAWDWNTVQTPDTGMLLTGTTGNSWIIAEQQDRSFDFAHAAATDPTLFIHSHNQNTSEYMSLAHSGTFGVFAAGTGGFLFQAGAGTNRIQLGSVGVTLRSDGVYGWPSSTDVTAAQDTLLTREAAGVIQRGVDLNGAAIAQTDKACDGITGTDIAGCDLIQAGGRGTGIGAPGDLKLQTAKDLATGTTAQTLFDRHFYRGKAKALTESSATTFVTINIPTTLTGAGGEVHYCLHANDATDVQERCGDVDFACVNKAGTVSVSTPSILGTESVAVSVGTLTNTFTLVASGATCLLQANAVSSLTQTVLDIRYSVEMHGSGTVTP